MKTSAFFLMVWMAAGQAFAGGKSLSFPVQYQGGSLNLRQNHNAKALVAGDEVVLVQHGKRISIPVASISDISYASDSRGRSHYVGLTWNGPEKGEVLFKLGAADCLNLLANLERLTGKRAVNTQNKPTVVRYGL